MDPVFLHYLYFNLYKTHLDGYLLPVSKVSFLSHVQTDATTPNIVGPTILGVVASVCPTILGVVASVCTWLKKDTFETGSKYLSKCVL